MGDVVAALANHAFEHLFIECLGWDRLRADVVVRHDGLNVELKAIAEKRGLAVFVGATHRTVLAHRQALRNMQRQLRKTHHEHILIHYCDTPRKQVWQWATVAANGRRVRHREHPFFSDRPPPRLLERIRDLEIHLDDEEHTDLTEVLARVRSALQPDSEYDLFAKRPWYAAESDRLAMEVKGGAPGALGKFVEFHMPLARKASRMLVRWFGMEPDDAEQTAMIGLMEAARRYDPERGFQFSTYAGFWIRSACQRYGLIWGLPMRIPPHFFWPCYKLEFVEKELIATYGQAAARERFEQVMVEAGVTPEQWASFRTARDWACFSDVDAPRHVLLGQVDQSDTGAARAMTDELCDIVQRSIQQLRPRDAQVVIQRHGIGTAEHTLEETAKQFRITRERIRQIQVKAESKLRVVLRQNGIRIAEADGTIQSQNSTSQADQT